MTGAEPREASGKWGQTEGPGRTLREHRGHLKAFVLQGRKRRKPGRAWDGGRTEATEADVQRRERNIRTKGGQIEEVHIPGAPLSPVLAEKRVQSPTKKLMVSSLVTSLGSSSPALWGGS